MQGFEPDALHRQGRLAVHVELAAALGFSDTQPVGRLIARSEETRAVTERLEQDRAQGIAAFPVVREAALELREQVRGEIADAYPGQDEEAGVVDHEREVALAHRGAPADELIARGGLPGRGGEAEHGQRLAVVGTHEVAHLGAGQGVVAEIVIARDEGVPQPSLGAAGDGLDAQRGAPPATMWGARTATAGRFRAKARWVSSGRGACAPGAVR